MSKSRFWLLTKVQLMSLFGLNKALHSGSSKDKSKFARFAVLGGLLVLCFGIMSFFYSVSIAEFVTGAGVGSLETLPAVMMLASSMLILVTGVYQGGKTLFKYKDYDMVMSMPASTAVIAGSRIALLYIYELLFVLVIMAPAGAVYGYYAHAPVMFYPVYLILMLFVPVVPLVISAALGSVVTVISSRFTKGSNLVNIILTFALVIGLMTLSFSMNGTDAEMTQAIEGVTRSVSGYYPLVGMFLKAVCELDVLSMIAFPAIAVALFAAFCVIVATRYRDICTRVSAGGAKAKKLESGDIRSSGVLLSLYRREIRQYLSSTIYVTNTAIGVVLAIAACAVVAVNGGMPGLQNAPLEEIPQVNSMIAAISPMLVSMLLGMCCTTGSSISIEGEKLWILKTLPVGTQSIFAAKILVNLTLTVPASIICGALLAIGFKMGGVDLLMVFVTPLVFSLFGAVFGIYVNLKIPKLEWKNEAQVVKQSAASAVSMFVPMLFCILGLAFIAALGSAGYIATMVFTALPLLAGAVFWTLLRKNGDKIFKKL